MASSDNDLLYAILAMDGYNQGYARGIKHDQTQIGSATVKRREEFTSDEEYAAWQAAGFYASAFFAISCPALGAEAKPPTPPP